MTENTATTRAGALYTRILADGREITVYPLLFTTRVCIGEADAPTYDDAWCYRLSSEALEAARTWDGEGDPPDGWVRHIGSGRRRPNGRPEEEFIRP